MFRALSNKSLRQNNLFWTKDPSRHNFERLASFENKAPKTAEFFVVLCHSLVPTSGQGQKRNQKKAPWRDTLDTAKPKQSGKHEQWGTGQNVCPLWTQKLCFNFWHCKITETWTHAQRLKLHGQRFQELWYAPKRTTFSFTQEKLASTLFKKVYRISIWCAWTLMKRNHEEKKKTLHKTSNTVEAFSGNCVWRWDKKRTFRQHTRTHAYWSDLFSLSDIASYLRSPKVASHRAAANS